jgi:hypothetical protein
MHTFTEKLGIVNQTISYMQDADNKAVLAAKNFDVTAHIARLQGELGAVKHARASSEENGSGPHPGHLGFADRELCRL